MPISNWSDEILVVDLQNEPMLSDELGTLSERLASARAVPDVVIDFRAVTYLNSSNIAQLLDVRRLVSAAHRSLRLCAVTDPVWSVMRVSRLERIFDFAEDTASALALLQLGLTPDAGDENST